MSRSAAALLLALAIEALLLLLLLSFIPSIAGQKQASSPSVFTVDAGPDGAEKETATPEKAKRSSRSEAQPSAVPPPEVPPPPVPVQPPRGPLPFIVMTRDEYRAARVAEMPVRPPEPEPPSPPVPPRRSTNAGDTPVVGTAPNGKTLYVAEWHRRPRQIELNAYLPHRWAREGVGLIYCRTVARYHVEDCRILDEAPRGSGYGNAVLQAAWQFLIRPPRVGGKEMVGEWVAVRIDYEVIVQ